MVDMCIPWAHTSGPAFNNSIIPCLKVPVVETPADPISLKNTSNFYHKLLLWNQNKVTASTR